MAKSNFYSRERRLNHLYKIINKRGEEITFKLNKTQKKLFDIEKEKNRGSKIWLAILKGRQLGMTTYKCIDKLDKALLYKNVTANIVAHKKEKLQDIFSKVKYAYEKLPNTIELKDGKVWTKPVAKYDNKNELYFKENNSRIKITLDSRSGTATDLHISELAFIEKAQEMMRGTLPAAEFADVTIETTANGMNYFKYLWDNTKQFRKVFFPWYLDNEYKKKAPKDYKPIKELKHLKDNLKLTNDQIYWYEEKYLEDPEGTLQEYPSTPEEAFISSGKPFYNIRLLNELKVVEGEVDENYEELIRYNKTRNKDAIFGIDLAEGLDHGDYTVIRVRDRNLNLIAHYRSNKIEPGDVPKIVNYIWNSGIEGIIAPERNNHGHTFIYAAKSYSWYNNIYIPRTDRDDMERTKVGQRGWHTNIKTRPLMLDEHKQAINDKIIQIDEPLKEECYTFVTINSKPQAEENCNDDIVMADAICCQMLKEQSTSNEKIPGQPQSYDDYLGL